MLFILIIFAIWLFAIALGKQLQIDRGLETGLETGLALHKLGWFSEWEEGDKISDANGKKFECRRFVARNFSAPNYIRSPYYPSNYPDWADCLYILEPAEGFYVRLTVFDRRMEPCCDLLLVYHGNETTSQPMWRIRGSRSVEPLVIEGPKTMNPSSAYGEELASNAYSSRNTMTVRFFSDLTTNSKGFYARFEAIPLPTNNEGNGGHGHNQPTTTTTTTSTTTETTTLSPKTSTTPMSNTDGPSNQKTTTAIYDLGWTQWWTTNHSTSTTSTPITTTTTPTTTTTETPTNGSNTRCPQPSDFTDPNGFFVSPNYPTLYPNSIKCFYQIRAPPHMRIQIRIDAFDTEPCCDYLEYFDGSKPTRKQSGFRNALTTDVEHQSSPCTYLRTTGSHSDATIFRGNSKTFSRRILTSDDNFLCFAFHSDPQNQYTGFFISYRFV